MIVLITGGARSGKSTFAEKYAAHLGSSGVYIATAQITDEEMEERIFHHRDRRMQSSFSWQTIEEPYALTELLTELGTQEEIQGEQTLILVDCLILWLSNWLLHYGGDQPFEKVLRQVDELVNKLACYPGTVLLVTNEVGYGLVPQNPLGRMFRDLAGLMNQRVAVVADQVFLLTAGIPVEQKGQAFRF
ncbi:bifunctional adenosylcobinamide kinase/adenosylcobinamide-phosphate guanylyltransferase [Brevibacillus sp. 179-C9.3 HS]|uniref:bifunctional adenosylcobinamide kinase/adenosylcobinamide-phosphate guanylyltransferase n=1 Tax=unclassified Brevibacillus TaxID=2684853 RepID=UPI0039A1135F